MSEFRQLIITNKGQALMAKLIAGTANVTFTKVAASSTTYSDSQIPGLTVLSNIKQQVAVSKVTKIDSVAVEVGAAHVHLFCQTIDVEVAIRYVLFHHLFHSFHKFAVCLARIVCV